MLKWQEVDKKRGVERARVFNGWLVTVHGIQEVETEVPTTGTISTPGIRATRKVKRPLNGMLSAIFVLDPAGDWKIEKEVG